MAVKAADAESEVIDNVCDRVREHLPKDRAEPGQAFVKQYYRWVPEEDLADRDPADLLGSAMAHWDFAQQREAGQTKVRVYNPDADEHGWNSPHTVVELVTDDMPFLVDSVTMELGRNGHAIDLVIHPVMRVRRDESGGLSQVLESDPGDDQADSGDDQDPQDEPRDDQRPADHQGPAGDEDHATLAESIMHVEVAREHDEQALDELKSDIERVLEDVRSAVADWKGMAARAEALAGELEHHDPEIADDQVEEAKQFLKWLADDHFTFLGYREYELHPGGDEATLKANADSGLGILREEPRSKETKLTRKALELARAPQPLVLTKANSRSTVHRPSYLDYVGVKRYDTDGELIGEARFLGLYTTTAYKISPREIPMLRGKVQEVLNRAGFPAPSHDSKALVEILEEYPRDSLLQIETDELFEIATGILGLGERPRVRLFVHHDPLERFVDCLVCIPRERFNTENRERVADILLESFDGTAVEWSVHLSESVLARVQYVVHRDESELSERDVRELEQQLAKAIRAWSEDLREALIEEHGEERGRELSKRYEHAFSPAYRADWDARSAVADIEKLEELAGRDEPIMDLYDPEDADQAELRCKLFSSAGVSLSDVLPTFEHMGAKVVDERPHELSPADREPAWLYDFGLRCVAEEADRVRDLFQDAFLGVWRGELEDDGFNGLVLHAEVSGRQIAVVRAIAKYLRQAGIGFSDAYMERTLLAHPEITVLLIQLFRARFDPDEHDEKQAEERTREIEEKIDEIESLDEDRIFRAFLSVVRATLRTNYFRPESEQNDGEPRWKPYISFKLDPEKISILPLPLPRFEIFVYSPRVEGVHLRGGKVARGGLRWSDRLEDFRTEVLGLMKAQMVKNALIVPVGSKGGFVVKRPPKEGGRDAMNEEAINCYKTFLRGLLDVTDNIVEGDVVGPECVVRYDEDDPYLVVAADKGTASFSDIANEVSEGYGFWLGDAFASGGSHGYDHKEMGITAKGGWESVKRHFRELGADIQSSEFTVVGIGDMSGDVFGNGMLLSAHIRLLGAFNHMHVFLDPDPDPEASFEERKRLFELERSGWDDYDESKISEGGGVWSRSEKSISVSKQVKEALGIDEDELAPEELIRAMMRAPVDLLWNGGIGTYVKASSESHGEVGDKSNDTVRVDASQLRCKVVGEGGNLGFTQAGRVEFAKAGGRINTDAIDNVAGVNCSDHEVNIKVLLDSMVHQGKLNEDQRNELLVEMTQAVSDRVLYASYTQTQAMSLALAQAEPMVDVHARLIRHLEEVAGLNRELEFLPNDDEITERKSQDQGLLGPELAVVMAYCKIHLYSSLLDSDLPEDSFLNEDLRAYFPAPLPERYGDEMQEHRLRREIIATVAANQLVDRAGTTFAFRLGEETSVSAAILARGFTVAREVFEMRPFWTSVEELDNKVEAKVQLRMLIEGRRLVERATRWLVRTNPHEIDIAKAIERYKSAAEMLADELHDMLEGADGETYERIAQELRDGDVPEELAGRVAVMPFILSVFDIVEVARAVDRDPEEVMHLYFRVASRLELNWLRGRIIELPRANRWQALARSALRDDLYSLHRELTQEVLEAAEKNQDSDGAIDSWTSENQAAADRCLGIISDIKSARVYDMTTLPVALREVRNLIDGGATGEGVAHDQEAAG